LDESGVETTHKATGFPQNTRNLFAPLAFAAGFIVRPFGALVFGVLGDMIGRKYTLLMTIVIMGLSTFLVCVLPNYESWGTAAPIVLILLRIAQGLALVCEYGGAAIYVAEHAPENQRGYFTVFMQTTATLGLLLPLIVILAVQGYVNGNFPDVPLMKDGAAVLLADGKPSMVKAFNAWGWCVPFIGSIFLLAISLYMRLQMNESLAFKEIKEEGHTSTAPLSGAFGNWKNGKSPLAACLARSHSCQYLICSPRLPIQRSMLLIKHHDAKQRCQSSGFDSCRADFERDHSYPRACDCVGDFAITPIGQA
jgi:MFS family permease